MAHLDGEGYNEAAAMLDDVAAREAVALGEVHDALFAEGAALSLPEVDLWSGIAERLDASIDESPRVARALMELGDAFRLGVPEAKLFDGAPGDMVDDVPLEMEAAIEAAVSASAAPELFVDLWTPLSRALPGDDESAVEPALEAALFALGADFGRHVPQAGIWEALTARPELEAAPGDAIAPVEVRNIVPFPVEKKPREERDALRWLRTAAVAAGLLLVAGYGGYTLRGAETPRGEHVAEAGLPGQEEGNGAVEQLARVESPRPAEDGSGLHMRPSPTPPGPRAKSALTPKARPVTLKEVVEAYRGDAGDLEKFGKWASLSREEAAALLQQSGLSREAVIGAAQFLDPEDAIAVLQAAVDNAPEDPYLRYALASRYGETTDAAGYQRALNEWREADPQNALPYYLQAQMMFASGDVAGATAAVNAGTQLPGASVYGAESARYQASALQASGKEADAARYLAAATAGSGEYDALRQVGDNLMDQARQLEASGQPEAAADLYDAVRVLGEQVMAMADVPQTQLVSLEIQQDAVSAMMNLQQVWTPDTVAALATMADSVLDGLGEITGLLAQISGFLTSNDMQQVLGVTNTILNGNLSDLWGMVSQ